MKAAQSLVYVPAQSHLKEAFLSNGKWQDACHFQGVRQKTAAKIARKKINLENYCLTYYLLQ